MCSALGEKPKLGGVAFVNIHYPATRADHPGARAYPLLVSKMGKQAPMKIALPGLARCGPVLSGEYYLGLHWTDGREPDLSSCEVVTISKGPQSYDLR